jgi:hypothetical protein
VTDLIHVPCSFSLGKQLRHTLHTKHGKPQIISGRFSEKKNLFTLPGNEPRTVRIKAYVFPVSYIFNEIRIKIYKQSMYLKYNWIFYSVCAYNIYYERTLRTIARTDELTTNAWINLLLYTKQTWLFLKTYSIFDVLPSRTYMNGWNFWVVHLTRSERRRQCAFYERKINRSYLASVERLNLQKTNCVW